MANPVRWLDDPAADPRIATALRDEVVRTAALPTAPLKAQIMAAAAAGVLPSTAIAGLVSTKVLLSTILLTATIAGATGYAVGAGQSPEHKAPTVAVAVGSLPEPVPVADLQPPAPNTAAPPLTAPPAPPRKAKTPPKAPKTEAIASAARATKPVGGGEVRDQLRLFERAEAALNEGRAEVALREFARYLKDFPGGPMVPEALLGQMDAALARGEPPGLTRAFEQLTSDDRLARKVEQYADRVTAALVKRGHCVDARRVVDAAAEAGADVAWLRGRTAKACSR